MGQCGSQRGSEDLTRRELPVVIASIDFLPRGGYVVILESINIFPSTAGIR